jgi:putative component of membrane protein insertase Oxa1/YidC/SpoIIIJ protein YidD
MSTFSARLILKLIDEYQSSGGGSRYFNTDCNFEPSCSEYARQAIKTLGLIKALPSIVARLKRCKDPDKISKDQDPFEQQDYV